MGPVKERRVSDSEARLLQRKKEKSGIRRKSLNDAASSSSNTLTNKIRNFGYQNKIKLYKHHIVRWERQKPISFSSESDLEIENTRDSNCHLKTCAKRSKSVSSAPLDMEGKRSGSSLSEGEYSDCGTSPKTEETYVDSEEHNYYSRLNSESNISSSKLTGHVSEDNIPVSGDATKVICKEEILVSQCKDQDKQPVIIDEIVILGSSDEEDNCIDSKTSAEVNGDDYDDGNYEDDDDRLTIDESRCEVSCDRSDNDDAGALQSYGSGGQMKSSQEMLSVQETFATKEIDQIPDRPTLKVNPMCQDTETHTIFFNSEVSRKSIIPESAQDKESKEGSINNEQIVDVRVDCGSRKYSIEGNEHKSKNDKPISDLANVQDTQVKMNDGLPGLEDGAVTDTEHVGSEEFEQSDLQENYNVVEIFPSYLDENRGGKARRRPYKRNAYSSSRRGRRGNYSRRHLQAKNTKLPPWAFGNDVTNMDSNNDENETDENVENETGRSSVRKSCRKVKSGNIKKQRPRKYKKGTINEETQQLASAQQSKECDHRIERDLPNHNWLEHKLHDGSISQSSSESVTKTSLLSTSSNSPAKTEVPTLLQHSSSYHDIPQISISVPTAVITSPQKGTMDNRIERNSLTHQQDSTTSKLPSASAEHPEYKHESISGEEKLNQEMSHQYTSEYQDRIQASESLLSFQRNAQSQFFKDVNQQQREGYEKQPTQLPVPPSHSEIYSHQIEAHLLKQQLSQSSSSQALPHESLNQQTGNNTHHQQHLENGWHTSANSQSVAQEASVRQQPQPAESFIPSAKKYSSPPEDLPHAPRQVSQNDLPQTSSHSEQNHPHNYTSVPVSYVQHASPRQQSPNQLKQPLSTSPHSYPRVSPHMQQLSPHQQSHSQLKNPLPVSPQLYPYSVLSPVQQTSPIPLSVSPQSCSDSPASYAQQASSRQQCLNQLNQPMSVSPHSYPNSPASHIQPTSPIHYSQNQLKQPLSVPPQSYPNSPSYIQQASPHQQMKQPMSVSPLSYPNSPSHFHQTEPQDLSQVQQTQSSAKPHAVLQPQLPSPPPLVGLQADGLVGDQMDDTRSGRRNKQKQPVQRKPQANQQVSLEAAQQQQILQQQQHLLAIQQQQLAMQQQQEQQQQLPQHQQFLQQGVADEADMSQQLLTPEMMVGMEGVAEETCEEHMEQDQPQTGELLPYNSSSRSWLGRAMGYIMHCIPPPLSETLLGTLVSHVCDAYDKGHLAMLRSSQYPYSGLPALTTAENDVSQIDDDVIFLTQFQKQSPQPAVPISRRRARIQELGDGIDDRKQSTSTDPSTIPNDDLEETQRHAELEYNFLNTLAMTHKYLAARHASSRYASQNRGGYTGQQRGPLLPTPGDISSVYFRNQRPQQYHFPFVPRFNMNNSNQVPVPHAAQQHPRPWVGRPQHPEWRLPNPFAEQQRPQQRFQQKPQQNVQLPQAHQQQPWQQQHSQPYQQQLWQQQQLQHLLQQQQQRQLYQQPPQPLLQQQQQQPHEPPNKRQRTNSTERQLPPQNGYFPGKYQKKDNVPQKESLSPPQDCPKFACYNCSSEAQFTCSGCRSVLYCTRQCQAKHWMQHADDCQRLKKLADGDR